MLGKAVAGISEVRTKAADSKDLMTMLDMVYSLISKFRIELFWFRGSMN